MKLPAGGGSAQELAFLAGSLEKAHRNLAFEYRGQHQPREPGAGTEIRQCTGSFRHQGNKLCAIPEMPLPQLFDGLAGHQIVPGIPVGQDIGISLQPGQCFT